MVVREPIPMRMSLVRMAFHFWCSGTRWRRFREVVVRTLKSQREKMVRSQM